MSKIKKFTVYLLVSKIKNKYISYVGYTTNIKERIIKHNSKKGAKFTKGNKWYLAFSKNYKSKSEAMKEEYKLKKNYILRKIIKTKFILNEKKNIHNSTI
tara:strand:- start:60 stop:359 length:300 start_codon:yes stop_codon:yes gene_type:complete